MPTRDLGFVGQGEAERMFFVPCDTSSAWACYRPGGRSSACLFNLSSGSEGLGRSISNSELNASFSEGSTIAAFPSRGSAAVPRSCSSAGSPPGPRLVYVRREQRPRSCLALAGLVSARLQDDDSPSAQTLALRTTQRSAINVGPCARSSFGRRQDRLLEIEMDRLFSSSVP